MAGYPSRDRGIGRCRSRIVFRPSPILRDTTSKIMQQKHALMARPQGYFRCYATTLGRWRSGAPDRIEGGRPTCPMSDRLPAGKADRAALPASRMVSRARKLCPRRHRLNPHSLGTPEVRNPFAPRPATRPTRANRHLGGWRSGPPG